MLCSYVFYGWWDWRMLGLILLTSVSTWGTALMMRGNRCGGDDFLPRCYNWAAADKYAKAAAVDPSCAETANAKRAKLAFPSKQDRFVRGLQDGQSFHVGCWIQENTTVR